MGAQALRSLDVSKLDNAARAITFAQYVMSTTIKLLQVNNQIRALALDVKVEQRIVDAVVGVGQLVISARDSSEEERPAVFAQVALNLRTIATSLLDERASGPARVVADSLRKMALEVPYADRGAKP